MVAAAAGIMVSKSISGIAFAYLAENLTLGVRRDLYINVLTKHLGWHDSPNNGSGVLSAALSSDCQKLNGVSSEGTSIMLEANFALLFGIALAFGFSWPIALCGIGITPFLVIAAAASAKADNK